MPTATNAPAVPPKLKKRLQEVCPTHGSVTTMWPVDISPMPILISGGAGITAFCDVVIRLEWRWHWTVYGSSFAGDELTLEEAQAKFKTAFERKIARGREVHPL